MNNDDSSTSAARNAANAIARDVTEVTRNTPNGLSILPALFLDRDGVIIEEVEYLSNPSEVRLIPGSAQAIARLNQRGIPVVVVTNQAGVGRGYFPEARVAEVHRHLDRLLAAEGATIDRYYYCPHHPTAAVGPHRVNCPCRKPQPGMLLRAAAELHLNLKHSTIVGDKRSDLEAGLQAGCHAILVRTGYGAEEEKTLGPLAAKVTVVADLAAAVRNLERDDESTHSQDAAEPHTEGNTHDCPTN
jgi:D-glycero-D-manno-heptose 1,7-bisphosphate phosphatase